MWIPIRNRKKFTAAKTSKQNIVAFSHLSNFQQSKENVENSVNLQDIENRIEKRERETIDDRNCHL